MKGDHLFIMVPGYWIGEGRVSFTASPEQLHFYTRWRIYPEENGLIVAEQIVELRDVSNTMENRFTFSTFTKDGFSVLLESEAMGSLHGVGKFGEKFIAWEFKNRDVAEGFEAYEIQENGDYMIHAEYAKEERFRTIVDGRIWKKEEQSSSN